MHARGRRFESGTVGLLGARTACRHPNSIAEAFSSWIWGENTSTAPYAGWRRVMFEAGDVEDVHGTDGLPPTEETRDEGAGRSAY